LGNWGTGEEIRDEGFRKLVFPIVNNLLSGHGKFSGYTINTDGKTLTFEFTLLDEAEVSTVSIINYEFIRDGSQGYIQFEKITSDNPKIDKLLSADLINKFAPGNRYPIPPELVAFGIRFL